MMDINETAIELLLLDINQALRKFDAIIIIRTKELQNAKQLKEIEGRIYTQYMDEEFQTLADCKWYQLYSINRDVPQVINYKGIKQAPMVLYDELDKDHYYYDETGSLGIYDRLNDLVESYHKQYVMFESMVARCNRVKDLDYCKFVLSSIQEYIEKEQS